jgi:hypothetical protein
MEKEVVMLNSNGLSPQHPDVPNPPDEPAPAPGEPISLPEEPLPKPDEPVRPTPPCDPTQPEPPSSPPII